MKKVNWLVVGIMSFVAILILFGSGLLMSNWGFRGWGMMGPNGMMENWGYSPNGSPLGWIGIIFMGMVPVSLIILAAFGTVWLVRKAGNSRSSPS